ncbi:hypothetical protein AAG906_003428 [Vitis piasezkii]
MGGICYERTLFGLQRALENRVSKYQEKKKAKGEVVVKAYSLIGFSYAFQVWAYEAIPLIGLKYVSHVSRSYPQILNWSATSAPRSIKVEKVFLEPNANYCKHVDKQGASAEMFHQSNASQDAKKDDLRHEKSSFDTATYVVAATTTMAEETTNDAVAPSIELVTCLLCLYFLILQCFDICVLLYLLLLGGVCNFRLRDVIDDEVERNDIPMDVNIGMEASRNLQLVEKHMTKELKDDYSNDDPVIDIVKLFDPTKRKKLRKEIEESLTLFGPLRPTSEEIKKWFQSLSNHGSWLADMVSMNRKSSYFFPKQNAQARWIKHDKKWNQFKLPNNDILIDYANGSQPLCSIKWPDVDIMHVPINVRASHWVLGVVHLRRGIIYVYDSLMDINNNARLQVTIKPFAKLLLHILNVITYYGFHALTLIICVPCSGDCGMFVVKYVEYLMYNHPLKSLTSARMDWFREKMAVELFYMKYLPM